MKYLRHQSALWTFQLGILLKTMDACHILLGRPWQFDGKTVYHGDENTFFFLFSFLLRKEEVCVETNERLGVWTYDDTYCLLWNFDL